MPRLSIDEKRAALAKKRAELDAQLKAIDAKTKTQARKDDTRRKVVAGALALEHMARNPQDAFSATLREIIAKSVDERARRLFPFLPESRPDAPKPNGAAGPG